MVFVAAVAVPERSFSQREAAELISFDRRPAQLNRWVFEHLCEAAGDSCTDETIRKYGYRLSRFGPSLLPGDRVRPHRVAEDRSLVCEYRCSLFFLDLVPGAHFAHPTVVGLHDRETGELQIIRGEWWPLVNDRVHVLDTLGRQQWSAVLEATGEIKVRKRPPLRLAPHRVPLEAPDLGSGQIALTTTAACPVRAVVVNGYASKSNTFDIDADGMYRILRGQGVPESQITYLGPYTTDGWDDKITPATLTTALQNAASASGLCEEFVFFISTHSGYDVINGPHLELRQSSGQHKLFDGQKLAELLSQVGCSTSTIIVEGCDNGKLKEKIVDEMKKQNRSLRLFFSAGHGKWSWGDLDTDAGFDDDNPEDTGSETIWGFIEAFGTGSSDGSPVGANAGNVSFAEATKYALDFDLSEKTDPGKFILIDEASPDPSAAQACCSFGTKPGLRIAPSGLGTDHTKMIGGVKKPAVKRCTNAAITVTIENNDTSPIPVATLRLHGSVWDSATGSWKLPVALADVAIATDLVKGTPQTCKLYWGVRPTYQVGDRVKLYATVDSPLDPVDFAACVQNGFGTTGCPPDQQWAELEVVVKKRCPLSLKGCNCLEYAGPDL
jgi:hypothetical protein